MSKHINVFLVSPDQNDAVVCAANLATNGIRARCYTADMVIGKREEQPPLDWRLKGGIRRAMISQCDIVALCDDHPCDEEMEIMLEEAKEAGKEVKSPAELVSACLNFSN